MDQGNVSLLRLTARKLLRQLAVRFISLGDDQKPAGPFVQAMDNARPQFSANLGKPVEAMKKRVDERSSASSFVFAGTCMDGHPGRFVYNDDAVIFVDHIERNIFRKGFERRQGDSGGDFD